MTKSVTGIGSGDPVGVIAPQKKDVITSEATGTQATVFAADQFLDELLGLGVVSVVILAKPSEVIAPPHFSF
jgi:hypothetical protein